MAMTPAYAVAHVFLPNLVKLKGGATVISAIERKEKVLLDQVWTQAMVTHTPELLATSRESSTSPIQSFRIGVIGLPAPKEMGEAHMAAIVVKIGDPAFVRYYTLEHDYVLKTKSNRTVLCDREGQKHSKHGDGPAITGSFGTDANAFIDCFMALLIPTTVTRR